LKYWRGYIAAAMLAAVSGALVAFSKSHTALVDMVYPYLSRIIQDYLGHWSAGVDFCLWQVLAVLLAVGMGVYTTLLPVVIRRVFGSREYAAIWALVSTVGCAGTMVGYPLWGTIYDLTGTYTLGLIGAAVLLAIAMWAHMQTLRNID